jgi:hypothetical protein
LNLNLHILKTAIRQRRAGNPKPLNAMLRNARHGLLHWRCVRCTRFKGPTLVKMCDHCQEFIRSVARQEY